MWELFKEDIPLGTHIKNSIAGQLCKSKPWDRRLGFRVYGGVLMIGAP